MAEAAGSNAPAIEPPTVPTRWFCVLASAALIFVCSYALATVHASSLARRVDPWQGRLVDFTFRFLLSELCVVFIAFCAIVLIWAVSLQPWAYRVLVYFAGHVWSALLFFACGCTAMAVMIWILSQVYGWQ